MKKKLLLSVSLTSILVCAASVNSNLYAKLAEGISSTNSTNSVKVTAQDVAKAKAKVDASKVDVTKAQADVDKATTDKKNAEDIIIKINSDITTANNAAMIVTAQDTIITNKTNAKNTADTNLTAAKQGETDAKTALTTAKTDSQLANHARDAKQADVNKKQQDLDNLSDTTVRKNITDTTAEITKVETDINAKNAQITDTNSKITAKQTEVDNYQPTVHKTDLNPDERNATAPARLEDYEYNKKNQPFEGGVPKMEAVNFNGVKIVELTATPEMEDFLKAKADYEKNPFDDATGDYKDEPLYRYKVDNRAFAKAFTKLVNQLRELNGVEGNLKVDEDYLAYATARANEMQDSGILTHSTKLTEPGPEGEHGAEDISARGTRGREGDYILFDHIVTNETLAYEHLLDWYSDFHNVHKYSYGHRRGLFTPMGGKIGVAMSTLSTMNPLAYFVSYNTNSNSGSEFTTDTSLGYPITVITKPSESYKRSVEIQRGFDESDKLNPTLFGKKMKFIEDIHYVFVKSTTTDNRAQLQAELDTLRAQKTTQEGERDQLVANKATLTQTLNTLNANLGNLSATRTAMTTALNQAKSDLATLTADATAKATIVTQKQKDLDDATKRVTDLTTTINNLQHEIDTATQTRNNAVALQAQLPQLQTRLSQAQTDKTNAEQRLTQATQNLTTAQNQLNDAESDYRRILNQFNIDNRPTVPTNPINPVNPINPIETPAQPSDWVQNDKGEWNYILGDGRTKATGWVQDKGTWYYLNASGTMQTGWVKDNGTWYYLNSSGAMQTGWVKDNGTWYYLNSSGVMQTGWVQDKGVWYYLNGSGAMQTGWVKDNGTWYYLNGSGAMQTGWFEVNGKWYYANRSGALLTNTTTPDGYRVNANGEWV